MWSSFLELYTAPFSLLPDWAKSLKRELKRIQDAPLRAIDVLEESLKFFEIADEQLDGFLTRSAMVLPGWAGVIGQLEDSSSGASVNVPRGTLLEFLSIRVLLDRIALEYACKTHGIDLDFEMWRRELSREQYLQSAQERDVGFLVFQVAKRVGLLPDKIRSMSHSDWGRLVSEILGFDSLTRRESCIVLMNETIGWLSSMRCGFINNASRLGPIV